MLVLSGFRAKRIRAGDGRGNLSFHYRWNRGNPYIASDGLVSTVTDLMRFAQMQMNQTLAYAEYAQRVWAEVNTTFDFPELGNRTDAMGLGWFIDRGNNITWHGGANSTFCTYIGFDTIVSARQGALGPSQNLMFGAGYTFMRDNWYVGGALIAAPTTMDLMLGGKINGGYFFTNDLGVTSIVTYRRTAGISGGGLLSMFDVFAGISIRFL